MGVLIEQPFQLTNRKIFSKMISILSHDSATTIDMKRIWGSKSIINLNIGVVMASGGRKELKTLSPHPKKKPQTKIARLLIPSIKHFNYFPAKWKSLAHVW